MRVPTRSEALATTAERIFARSTESPDGCRLWVGPLNHAGYAVVRVPGGHGTTGAHRAIYEWAKGGPLPEEMHVDHKCHSDNLATCTDGPSCLHRRCVEPTHLELVTCLENQRRGMKAQKPECVNGHERTPENTYIRTDRPGVKQCRPCNRDRQRRYKSADYRRTTGP